MLGRCEPRQETMSMILNASGGYSCVVIVALLTLNEIIYP